MDNCSDQVKEIISNPVIEFQSLQEELIADTETPVSVYLKCQSKYSCLLESVEGEERLARYSYIAQDPFAILSANIDGEIHFEILNKRYANLKKIIEQETSVRAAIEKSFSLIKYNPQHQKDSQMLHCGAFGLIGYDAMHFVEVIPRAKEPDPAKLPDVYLMFYDTLIAFDNIKRKLFIISNYIDEAGKAIAKEKIQALKQKILSPLTQDQIKLYPEKPEPIVSNTEKEDYLKKVLRAKEYITAGDIFQVQISQRLERKLNTRPFDVYRVLRTINPSPYLFYYDLGETQIVGSSPELLVKVEKNANGERVVETRPIAGTRHRGDTREEDERIARELLSDEKERAEHLMLIDLSRNDVGRIAKVGTVETNEMMIVERYSHVMHIVSNVRGILDDQYSDFEAFWACFPAGTLTGAPKIRAMEIISEFEPEKRGLYGGAVGYFGFDGHITTAIAIRTMVVHDEKIYFQAAGGIVADSQPEFEFEETMKKMRAGLRTIDALIK